MNFQDLLTKMKQIDEGDPVVTTSTEPVEECGEMMPAPHMSAPKQSDSVTMNVSMNGSGAGGIKDLMDILKNIESGAHNEPQHGHGSDDEIIVGMGEDGADGNFTDATTEPDTEVFGVDTMTRTGDDLASKNKEAEKVNGGGNPIGVDEALIARLTQHYQAIKG